MKIEYSVGTLPDYGAIISALFAYYTFGVRKDNMWQQYLWRI